MSRGLFQMGTMGWTPAAQLATQNLQGSAQSLAAMDKKKEATQTTTTEYDDGGRSVFGDIMGGIGVGLGAYTGLGGTLPQIFAGVGTGAMAKKKIGG